MPARIFGYNKYSVASPRLAQVKQPPRKIGYALTFTRSNRQTAYGGQAAASR
jgi:hypothetical protein